jgi:hypothetical protein
MIMTFVQADLAALCNSKRLMVRRWGHDGFDHVSQRLLELAAVATASEIELLPGVGVRRGTDGGVRIEFDDGTVVIEGTVFRAGGDRGHGVDRIRVTGVQFDDRRGKA